MTVAAMLKHKGADVVAVRPTDSVAEVTRVLTARRIGAAVVLDGERIVGILSERDVVAAVARDGAGALAAT